MTRIRIAVVSGHLWFAVLLAASAFAQASSPIVQVEPSAIPATTDRRDQWIFWQSKNLEWRWRRIASNGRIVGSSSESYSRFYFCRINAERNGWKSGRAFRTLVLKYR